MTAQRPDLRELHIEDGSGSAPIEDELLPEEEAYMNKHQEPSCLGYCCGLDVVYGGWVGFLNMDRMLMEEELQVEEEAELVQVFLHVNKEGGVDAVLVADGVTFVTSQNAAQQELAPLTVNRALSLRTAHEPFSPAASKLSSSGQHCAPPAACEEEQDTLAEIRPLLPQTHYLALDANGSPRTEHEPFSPMPAGAAARHDMEERRRRAPEPVTALVSTSMTSSNRDPMTVVAGDVVTVRVVASDEVTPPRILIPSTSQVCEVVGWEERASLRLRVVEDERRVIAHVQALARAWEGTCRVAQSEAPSPSRFIAKVGMVQDRFGNTVSSPRDGAATLTVGLSRPVVVYVGARPEGSRSRKVLAGDTIEVTAKFSEYVSGVKLMAAGEEVAACFVPPDASTAPPATSCWTAEWTVHPSPSLKLGRAIPIGVCEYVDKHGLLNHCRITGPLGTDEVGMPAESVIFTLPNWACDDSVDEVVHWMEQVLGKEVAAPLAVRGDGRTSQREREVCAALQDGVLLCMLVQRIRPGLLKGKVHTSQAGGAGDLSAASARARATCMHNIGQFLGACRQLGVPGYSLFQPEDLLDARAPEQVLKTIHTLGRQCHKLSGYDGACMGTPSKASDAKKWRVRGESQNGMFKFAGSSSSVGMENGAYDRRFASTQIHQAASSPLRY